MAETAGFMTDLPQSAYLSLTMRRAISAARQRSHRYVTLEHLLLALLDDPNALQIMEAVRADISAMRVVAVETVNRNLATLYAPGEFELRPSYKVERVLQTASDDAHRLGCVEVDAAFVVGAISREVDSPAAEIVRNHGFKYTNAMTWLYTNRGRPRNVTAAPSPQPQVTPVRSEPARPAERLEAAAEERNEEAETEHSAQEPQEGGDEFELEILEEEPSAEVRQPPSQNAATSKEEDDGAAPNRWSGRGAAPAEKAAPHPAHSAADEAEEEPEPLTEVVQAPEVNAPSAPAQEPAPPSPVADRAAPRHDPRQHPGSMAGREPAYGRQSPPAVPAPSPQAPGHRPQPNQPPYARTPQRPRPRYEDGQPPVADRRRESSGFPGGPPPGPEAQRARPRPQGADMYGPAPQTRRAEPTLPPSARLDEMRVRPVPNSKASAPAAPQKAKKRGSAPSAGGKPRSRRHRAGESKLGKLIENIPRRMRSGIPERIEVRISREETQALMQGMEGRAEPVRHDITVTQAMSVMLRAPNGGFTIETISPETQWVYDRPDSGESDHYGRWRWVVTPTQSGQRSLQLIVSARTADRNGNIGETALPDQIIDVRVRINYQRVLQRAMQWIIVMAAGGVISELVPLAWRTFGQ